MADGGSSIPANKPPVYTGTDPAKIRENEEALHEYWNAVQAAQAMFQEQSMAESNMNKNKHDAMMAVINNMKS